MANVYEVLVDLQVKYSWAYNLSAANKCLCIFNVGEMWIQGFLVRYFSYSMLR